MLHGFGGTARHWDRVVALLDRERYSPLALELADAQPLSLAGAIDLIAAVARAVRAVRVLDGWPCRASTSRVAMPERVSRLVLVSASAGIEDPGSAPRTGLLPTNAWRGRSSAGTVEDFVARWRETPLFAADPDWVQDAGRRRHPQAHARADRERRCAPSAPGCCQPSPTGLANWRCRQWCSPGHATAATARSGSAWRVRSRAATTSGSPAPVTE
jgi:hypothetical protein